MIIIYSIRRHIPELTLTLSFCDTYKKLYEDIKNFINKNKSLDHMKCYNIYTGINHITKDIFTYFWNIIQNENSVEQTIAQSSEHTTEQSTLQKRQFDSTHQDTSQKRQKQGGNYYNKYIKYKLKYLNLKE